jgi:hypothetical protein
MRLIRREKMFKLAINRTGLGQIYKCRMNGSTVRVEPNGVVDTSLFNSSSGLEPIDNFLEEMDRLKMSRFFLYRSFSLGDVLTLVPVYRMLLDRGYEPYMRTKRTYLSLLNRLNVNVEDERHTREGAGLYLDYVVEKDHYHPKLQKMHRTEIYARAVGLPFKPKELDWSMDLSRFPDHSWNDEPYVIFQGRGAVDRRALPNDVIQEMIWLMNLEKIRVIYIGEQTTALSQMEGIEDLTKFLFMEGSIEDLFSWIAGAKAVISMDSAPMWISYFTNTPVIACLGPGRPQERLGLHPRYPEGAVGIRLNEELECDSCFENAVACSQKFNCIKHIKADRLYELMRPKLLEFWNG